MPNKLKVVAWHLHTFTSIVQNETSLKNVLPNESGVFLDSKSNLHVHVLQGLQ